MTKRLVALSLAIVAATVFGSSAQAQRPVALRFASEARTGTAAQRNAVRTNFVRVRRVRRFNSGSAFASPFYSDYDFDPGMVDAPTPQILLQGAPSPILSSAPVPTESLVLELQGDHWVRLTNYGQSQTGPSLQPQSEQAYNSTSTQASASRQIQPTEPPTELPPAILVFRDGHQEQIGKYVIKDAAIYTSADYWTTGSWTRKVRITALNIPATLRLNRDRGANFTLPSGPHEVMIRP
jgi:hypothetical protein